MIYRFDLKETVDVGVGGEQELAVTIEVAESDLIDGNIIGVSAIHFSVDTPNPEQVSLISPLPWFVGGELIRGWSPSDFNTIEELLYGVSLRRKKFKVEAPEGAIFSPAMAFENLVEQRINEWR